MTVEVVSQVEDAGEAGAGELRFVPSAVRTLSIDQELQAALEGGVLSESGGAESEQRPGGLRRRRRALAPQRRVVVRVGRLAPTSVRLLVVEQPFRAADDGRVVGGDSAGDGDRRTGEERSVSALRSDFC